MGVREEAMNLQRQRILELGDDRQAGLSYDPARACAVQSLEVSDLGGVLALAVPSRREVGLEGHLDEHRPADSRHLGQERGRVGNVLEHVETGDCRGRMRAP